MKLNRKMLLTTIGIGTALVLAGCGASHNSTHKSTSVSSPSTTKVTSHKSHKDKKVNHTNDAKSQKSSSTDDSNSNTTNHSSSNNNANTHSTSPKAHTSNTAKQYTVASTNTTPSNSNNTSSNDGLPTVNLGDGVVGHEDRGAGQEYITFNIKGKSYTVHGNDVQPGADALPKAQNIVHSVLG